MANNRRNNNNNNNADKKKRSGCKHTTYYPETGPNKGIQQHLTTAWRISNGELISIRAVTTSKSRLSDKGWYGSVAVTFTNTKSGAKFFYYGTMQANTGKVVIDELAVVLNPKAKNGGYAGTYINN